MVDPTKTSARLLALEDTVELARDLVAQLRGTPLTPAAHSVLSQLEDQLELVDSGDWLAWYLEQLERRQ